MAFNNTALLALLSDQGHHAGIELTPPLVFLRRKHHPNPAPAAGDLLGLPGQGRLQHGTEVVVGILQRPLGSYNYSAS